MTLRYKELPDNGFAKVGCDECGFTAWTESRITVYRLAKEHKDCEDDD